MATGRKTGGRNLRPGQTANPNGRPPVPPDLKEARSQGKEDLERALLKALKENEVYIEAILIDPGATNLQRLIASVIQRAVKTGDFMRAAFIFDRAFGKVPEKHELQGSVHAALVAAIRGHLPKADSGGNNK